MADNSEIPIDDMVDGDYIAFQTQEGFVMYHKSDGELWRTIASSAETVDRKNAKRVDGIKASDGLSRIVMSGHETIEVPEDLGKLNKLDTPEQDQGLEMDLDLMGAEMGDEVTPDDLPTLPSSEPEALPEIEVPPLDEPMLDVPDPSAPQTTPEL